MAAVAGRSNPTFGEYTLRRKLGAGGMSEVWRAEKVGPGGAIKPCAIKIILPHFKDSEKRVQRFLDEVRLSAQLSHANLVEVLNFGVEDGQYYLVLELIRGKDLGSLIEALAEDANKRPPAPADAELPAWQREMLDWHPYLVRGVLPPVMVAWIGMKACIALAYVHSAEIRDGDQIIVGLIHRDISLCNIMLDVMGRLKITDLGIAKALKDGNVASATDTAWGKLAFAPAEQLGGLEIDASVDLYALAIALYILLTGNHPFDDPLASPNEHPFNRAGRMARDERKPMSELLPDVPAALQQILQDLIQSRVENRKPRRADELVDRFHEIIKSLGSDLYRLDKQAAALVKRVYVDDDKDRTQDDPIPARAVDVSHERPVSKLTAADTPAARGRQRVPDTIVDHTAPLMDPAPRSSRTTLWALIGAASLILAALVAGVAGFVVIPAIGPSTRETSSPAQDIEQPATGAAASDSRPNQARADDSSESIRAEPPTRPSAPPEPAEPVADVVPRVAPPERVSEQAAGENAPAAETGRSGASARGTLHLTAAPLGELFVDGRHAGTDSARVRVRPGSHRIGVGPRGSRQPTRTETVQVPAGGSVQRMLHP